MKTVFYIMSLAIGMIVSLQQTSAQNLGGLRGQVIDTITGETVVGANVYVMVGEQMRGTTTDIDGRFILKPLEPGTYTLNVSFTGMKKQLLVKVKPDQLTFVPDIFLADSMMDEIVVSDYANPLIDPNETSVQTVTYKEIKNSPNLRDVKKLSASMNSGIMVTESGDAYVRGSRSDAAIYFVDGVKVTSGSINVPGAAIGSLTVYTGGVPAKYGDVTSGVIIIETRSYFDLWREANQQ